MNVIYLVRHGECESNITKEFSFKAVDRSLTAKGVLQAKQTADYFANVPIDEIYCSPLKRASETADAIGRRLGISPIPLEKFREVNVGSLELSPPSKENWEVYLSTTEKWMKGDRDARLPGGENAHELTDRLIEGLVEVNSHGNDRQILIVTHGGIVLYSLHKALGILISEKFLKTPIHNCAVTVLELEYDPERLDGRIVRWMDSSHITGGAADFVCGLPDDENGNERTMKYRFGQKIIED